MVDLAIYKARSLEVTCSEAPSFGPSVLQDSVRLTARMVSWVRRCSGKIAYSIS